MSISHLEGAVSKGDITGPMEGVHERDTEREIDLEAPEPKVGWWAAIDAIFLYEMLAPAHGPDICTAVTAHHPNFSHLLYAARDAGGG